VDESTRAVYETHAAEWAERRPPSLVDEAASFSRRVLPGRPIVDVGSGAGGYFPFLRRPLVGLDGARAMLLAGRGVAADVPVVQGDLEALPFAPRRLGGAWARASYLHLRRFDLPAALAHLQHALAVGAPLEMTLRAGTGEGPLPNDDFPGRFFARWEAEELAPLLLGAGFTVDELSRSKDWVTVRARAARTLPDFVGPGMRLLICGLNPSVVSADRGFGYAGATNRFWRAAVLSGVIAEAHARQPFLVLARDRVGMTDLVKRATPRASELQPADYRAGAARVAALVAWLRPEAVVFVGLAGYRAAIDRAAHAGWQEVPFGGVDAYVMPSTSGLNAATSLGALVEHLQAAHSKRDGS
jgi:TDG/mug DNA glycosylase family protein